MGSVRLATAAIPKTRGICIAGIVNMKTLLHPALLLLLVSSPAFAPTPTGQDVNATVTGYTYTEPGATSISIHGPKAGGEYTGTVSLNKQAQLVCPGQCAGHDRRRYVYRLVFAVLIRPSNTFAERLRARRR